MGGKGPHRATKGYESLSYEIAIHALHDLRVSVA
jgi:hypothetical protein